MSIRFIAGAVCPKCGAMDTLKAGIEADGQTQRRECVDCGYIDRVSTNVNTPRNVATRVTPEPTDDRVEAEPVTLIDPYSNSED